MRVPWGFLLVLGVQLCASEQPVTASVSDVSPHFENGGDVQPSSYGAPDHFEIDGNLGQLPLETSLDYEADWPYDDLHQNSSTLQSETDVNEPLLSAPQQLETGGDVERLLYDTEQQAKASITRQLLGELRTARRQAGRLQSNIIGMNQTHFKSVDVSALYPFTYEGRRYAVVAQRLLNESYIAMLSDDGGDLVPEAYFSVDSFNDSQYTAAFGASLQQRVVELRAHVYRGSVFIMCALEHSLTLLFLVSAPSVSWTPKYQDTVLSQHEFASDFAFFEEHGELRVLVTVGERRAPGQTEVTAAHQSYMYALSGGIKWLQLHVVPTPLGASAVTTFVDKRWTYIVIGQADVQSLVYRHHWDSRQLELFQYLPSRVTLSVQAFRHARQWYVLLVNADGAASLFWWSADQLFAWQTLDVVGAERALFGHVGAFNDDEKYIYIVTRRSVAFYTSFASYSGHFDLTFRYDFNITALNVQGAYAVQSQAGSHFLLVSLGGGAGTWVTFRLSVTKEEVEASPPQADPLLTCLEEAQRRLRLLDDRLEALLRLAERLFVADTPAAVGGAVTVATELRLPEGSHLLQLSVAAGTAADPQPLQLEQLEAQLNGSAAAVAAVNATLPKALTASSRQEVTARYGFSTLSVTGGLFVNGVTSLGTLHGLPFSRLLHAALTAGSDQQLLQPLQLAAGGVMQLTVAAGGRINGVEAADLMLRHGRQTVSGRHRYEYLGIMGDLRLSRLNGLRPQQLLLRGQTLNVTAANATDGAALHIQRLLPGSVNGRPYHLWRADAIRLDASHVFEHHVELTSARYTHVNMRQLNGQLLTPLLRALWKPTSAGVGRLVFHSAPSVTRLRAATVNGLHLPTAALTADTPQVLTAHVQVDRLAVSGHLAAGVVNGLDLSADVISAGGPPGSVSGLLRFAASLTVSGDVVLAAGATLNGLHVSTAADHLQNATTLMFPAGAALRGSWRVVGGVTIASIGGHDVSALAERFWLRTADQHVTTSVGVTRSLQVAGALTVGTLGGVAPSRLLDVTAGGILQQPLVLSSAGSAGTLLLSPNGLVNNRSLAQFAQTVVTLSGAQAIAGAKTFATSVLAAQLSAASVNGLRPADLLLTDGSQQQTGSLTFTSDVEASGGVQTTGDVTVTDTVNGYAVTSLLERIADVWSNSSEITVVVRGDAHFSDLHVLHTLHGRNISALLAGLLSVTEQQRLTSALSVAGDVRLLSHVQLTSANGLDWRSYLSSLVLSDAGGAVSGVTRLTSQLQLLRRPLRVTELNGFTLQKLRDQFLTLNTAQEVRHRVTVAGSVQAATLTTSLVNNAPVDQLMFIDAPIEFHQPLHLFAPVQTTQLSVVSGEIGRCHLPELWRHGLRRGRPTQTLNASAAVRHLTVTGGLSLTQSGATQQLRRLLDRVVTADADQLVTAPVTAALLTARSPLVVRYNGAPLAALYEDAVTVDGAPLAVTATVTCAGDVTLRTITAREALLAAVSGVPLAPWLESLLLPGGQQETRLRGRLTLPAAGADHVIAAGLVNGRPAAPWLQLGERVEADVYLDAGVRVHQWVLAGGRVDGVAVTQLLARAVRVGSGPVYAGRLTIAGDVLVLGGVAAPQLNGLTLSDLLLNHQLSAVQLVTGAVHFSRLHVQGSLCAPLPWSPLGTAELCSALLSSAALPHVQLVSGHLTFQHSPPQLSGGLQQLLHNVTATAGLLAQHKQAVAGWMEPLRRQLRRLGALAGSLSLQPERSVDLAYLLLVQRVLLPHAWAVHWAPAAGGRLQVLLRAPENCSLPAGCLCRRTAELAVHQGGLLVPRPPTVAGQRWQFQLEQPALLVTVTALSDSHSARCQSDAEPPQPLLVTAQPPDALEEPTPEPVSGLVAGGHVSAAAVFNVSGRAYMAVGYSRARAAAAGALPPTQLFVREGAAGRWRLVQSLPVYGVQSLQTTELGGQPHLLVVNQRSRQPLSLQGEVQLLVWDRRLAAFAEVSVLYHADVRDARFLRQAHAQGRLFAVVADQDGLTLLEYSDVPAPQYRLCQYVAEPGVAATAGLRVGGETLLAAFSAKRNQLLLLLLTDQAGLQPHSRYPATAVRHLTVFSWHRQLYLAAVHQHGLVVYCLVMRGRYQLAPVTAAALRLPPLLH